MRLSLNLLTAVITASFMPLLLTCVASAHTYLVDQTTKTSPNGVSMAILERYSDNTTKLLCRSDSFQTFDKVESFPFVVEDFMWLNDDQSVVYLAKSDDDRPAHLYKTDTASKLTVDLTPFPRRTAAGYYLSDDGKLFVLLDLDEESVFDVYQVDSRSGNLVAVDAPLKFPDSFLPTAKKTITPPSSLSSLPMPGQDRQALEAGPKLMQIALFSDTGKESCTELEGTVVKPWTKSERQQVEDAWRQIVARVPALVMRAANGRRIVLMRCTKIPQQASHMIPGIKPQDAPGEARAGNLIFLSDLYFKGTENDRIFSLVHELVHIADRYGRLSLSKEWTDLAREKINAVRSGVAARKRIGLNSGGAEDDQLARCFNLPTAYAASGFQEALADVTAAWVLNYGQPSDAEKAFIRKTLFTLQRQAMCDDETMLKTDLECKDDLKKLVIAREILARDPDCIAARLLELNALFGLNRQREQEISAHKLVDLLKSRTATTGDYGYGDAFYFLASSEYNKGNYRVALKLVRDLLILDPDNTRYKEAEKGCLNALRGKKR